MKTFTAIVATALLAGACLAQDGLLGKKGGSSGGGGGSGKSGSVGDSRKEPAPTPRRSGSGGTQERYEGRMDTGAIRPSVRDSRSGPVRYGTQNNLSERVLRSEPPRIQTPRFEKGGLGDQVLREENTRVTYRRGYYGYNWDWRDDYFGYPYYRFGWQHGCVFSPWYWYPHLPGYIVITRISWSGSRFYFGWGESYDWGRRYDRSDQDLQDAIEDIERAWKRRDRRSIERLVPARGRVVIDLDRSYAYTVDADDFYDMLRDAVETTRTLDYRIVDVRYERRSARVVAVHEYQDPWGRVERATHAYILELGRRGYEIAEFAIRRDRFLY